MLSACYEVVTGREPSVLRAYLLAVLVQLIAVNTLAEFGWLNVAILPFFGILTVMGGFVFGLGMTLAVGCIGAVFTRAGEGKGDYIFAMLAFGLGAWASNNWLVPFLRGILGAEGVTLGLHRVLDLDRWVVIAVVVVAALLWVIRGKRVSYKHGWDWMITGSALGFICTAAWITSSLSGRPYGLGTVQGSDSIATLFLERDVSALNWNFFVVAGIPLGSFVATRFHGSPPSKPLQFERIWHATIGGLLMGIGAMVAAGDNVLHGLSGVPMLAVGSMLFMVCMFLGVWLGVKLGWMK